MNKRFVFSIFLMATICLMFASSATAKPFEFQYQKIYEVSEPIVLDIEHIRGDIHIIRTDVDRLIVEAVKTIYAANRLEAEEIADHVEIVVKESKNNYSIKTNYIHMFNRSRSFWEKLLGGSSDSYGDVSFYIQLPIDCKISVNLQAGNILIENNEGSIDIANAGPGKVVASYCSGPLTIRQPIADIDLQWVEGDIRIKSESGKIKINQLAGGIDLTTLSADVDIQTELITEKSFMVESTTGRINFAIPESASGTLRLASRSGEIKANVPISIKSMARNHLEGEFGGGGVRIVLSSSTGDVTVAQY